MKNIYFILFLLIVFMHHAKGQSGYSEAIKKGDDLLKDSSYTAALLQYFAAEAYEPTKRDTVQIRIDTLFKKIEALRKQADFAKKEALKEKDSALKNLEKAQLAENKAMEAKRSDSIARVVSDSLRGVSESLRIQDSISRVEAQRQKDTATREKNKVVSRNMANESIMLLSENQTGTIDAAKTKIDSAYKLNLINNDTAQNKDIYNALNLTLTKSIGFSNQLKIHDVPVRCIAGIPGTNIIFSGDENGSIKKSSINDKSIVLVATREIKGQVRALSVVPGYKKMVYITNNGKGRVVDTSLSDLDLKIFNFNGIGKAIQFKGNEDFVVLSSEGLSKNPLIFPERKDTIQRKGIEAFLIDKTGKFYLSFGMNIFVYKTWEDVKNKNMLDSFPVNDTIISLSIDNDENYIAAGTLNGKIWIKNLKNDSSTSKKLHISRINNLKFSMVDGKLQLAAAGADQKIVLIDVKDFMSINKQDVLTLSGHTKWVYALYYSNDENNNWLYSSGEDNKIMRWIPSMKVLYNEVNKKDKDQN